MAEMKRMLRSVNRTSGDSPKTTVQIEYGDGDIRTLASHRDVTTDFAKAFDNLPLVCAEISEIPSGWFEQADAVKLALEPKASSKIDVDDWIEVKVEAKRDVQLSKKGRQKIPAVSGVDLKALSDTSRKIIEKMEAECVKFLENGMQLSLPMGENGTSSEAAES